jgi:diguanylate cyclase (GGDEF)-like protein
MQLPAAFPAVHAVSLAWLDPEHEWSRELQREEAGHSTVAAFVSLASLQSGYPPARPQLGPLEPGIQQQLFSAVSAPLRSVALMPLRLRGELVGCLNQASFDSDHFSPVVATDLLEHMAAVTALCVDNAANRARLRRDGLTDALTGVANRRFFERRLQEEISLWRRHGANLSCLLVDIDHFKQINDRYGHLVGDRMLQGVAQTLSTGLRSSDVLARYGGEEFALLLPATDSRQAGEIAERLRGAIEDAVAPPGSSVPLTVSIGLASLDNMQRQLLREPPGPWLLQRADQALYQAKAQGRNRVVSDARGTTGTTNS